MILYINWFKKKKKESSPPGTHPIIMLQEAKDTRRCQWQLDKRFSLMSKITFWLLLSSCWVSQILDCQPQPKRSAISFFSIWFQHGIHIFCLSLVVIYCSTRTGFERNIRTCSRAEMESNYTRTKLQNERTWRQKVFTAGWWEVLLVKWLYYLVKSERSQNTVN